MRRILIRTATCILMLLAVSAAVFFALRCAVSDPILTMVSPEVLSANADNIDALRDRLGLNDPLPVQYFRWLSAALRGDFGYSLTGARVRRHPLSADILHLSAHRRPPLFFPPSSALRQAAAPPFAAAGCLTPYPPPPRRCFSPAAVLLRYRARVYLLREAVGAPRLQPRQPGRRRHCRYNHPYDSARRRAHPVAKRRRGAVYPRRRPR